MSSSVHVARKWVIAGVLFCGLSVAFQHQQATEGTRGMWNQEFLAQRPGGNRTSNQKAKDVQAAKAATSDALIGVTVWKYRGSRQSDPEGARILLHERDHRSEFTLVRVDSRNGLTNGDRVRLSIQSARPGYLYVINRETYSSGAPGDPYLTFPARQILGGANRITPGRVIELPDWNDDPPYFTLVRNSERVDYAGEKVILLLTPEPLPGLMATRKPQRLEIRQVQEWQKKWGVGVQALVAGNTNDQPMSRPERQAAEKGTLLSANDPAPHTLFRVEAPEHRGVMVAFDMRVH